MAELNGSVNNAKLKQRAALSVLIIFLIFVLLQNVRSGKELDDLRVPEEKNPPDKKLERFRVFVDYENI